jgi:hypothetical protein
MTVYKHGEAREQERLESAYLELLKLAEQVGIWAQMVYPVFQSGPPPDTPLPSLEVQADTAALVAAFGTDEVRTKAEAFAAATLEQRVDISATAVVIGPDGKPKPNPLSPGRSGSPMPTHTPTLRKSSESSADPSRWLGRSLQGPRDRPALDHAG